MWEECPEELGGTGKLLITESSSTGSGSESVYIESPEFDTIEGCMEATLSLRCTSSSLKSSSDAAATNCRMARSLLADEDEEWVG